MDKHEKIFAYMAEKYGLIFGICDAKPLNIAPKTAPFVTKDFNRRINPALTLPNVKSIIVVGKGYAPSPFHNLSSLGCAADYHAILTDILKRMGKIMATTSIMVDTGPLMEKAFAVKAGIGFWGKNTLIISKKFGSFFNIGIILTEKELVYSAPSLTTACPADCNICIKSCPTGALDEYVLDTSRCISYLTQKKRLSTDEAKLLNNQIYGCDLCQIHCPFNGDILAKVKKSGIKFNPADISKLDRIKFNPADILKLDAETFEKQFGKTAAAWCGLEILKRNVQISQSSNFKT
ncbi:MAG: DUF1730 domain-containing protein [Turicibacter sp.]|nr:DUF1730 domain-containing protein [Turicibacter sp.]